MSLFTASIASWDQSAKWLQHKSHRGQRTPCMPETKSHAIRHSNNHLFVFGLGYTGRALAEFVMKQSWYTDILF